MNFIILLLKTLCLILAIAYTFSNIVKAIKGHEDISSVQVFLMASSIAGFILLQYWI